MLFYVLLSMSCILSASTIFLEEQNFTKDEIELSSECMGNLLWQNLNDCCSHYDLEIILRTIKELSTKEKNPMNIEECSKIMEKVWAKMIDAEAHKNLVKSELFLKQISAKQGVTEVVPGKLYYEILQAGSGVSVTDQSSPLLHFIESDFNGNIIRNTFDKAPIKITLAETILGFSKGVNGMKPREKRKIYVHPDLGYGKFERAESELLLIYEVEIINTIN